RLAGARVYAWRLAYHRVDLRVGAGSSLREGRACRSIERRWARNERGRSTKSDSQSTGRDRTRGGRRAAGGCGPANPKPVAVATRRQWFGPTQCAHLQRHSSRNQVRRRATEPVFCRFEEPARSDARSPVSQHDIPTAAEWRSVRYLIRDRRTADGSKG